MELGKVQNAPKLSEVVLQTIIDAISTGKIKINDELPTERDLSEMLGVSRGSLRESLAVLEFLGIIENRGNRKVVVRGTENIEKALSIVHISKQQDIAFDFIEFRRVVETFSAELACIRAEPEDIMVMQKAVEKLENNPEDLNADYEFHINLAKASHNSFLAAIEDLLVCMLADIRYRSMLIPGRKEEIIKEHKFILEAIMNKDAYLAKQRMLNHLNNIERVVKDSITQEGSKF